MGTGDHVATDDGGRRLRRADPNRPTTRQVTVEAQWTVPAPADEEAVTATFRKAEAYRQSLGGPGPDIVGRPIRIRPEGNSLLVVMQERQSNHGHPVEITEQPPPVYRDIGSA